MNKRENRARIDTLYLPNLAQVLRQRQMKRGGLPKKDRGGTFPMFTRGTCSWLRMESCGREDALEVRLARARARGRMACVRVSRRPPERSSGQAWHLAHEKSQEEIGKRTLAFTQLEHDPCSAVAKNDESPTGVVMDKDPSAGTLLCRSEVSRMCVDAQRNSKTSTKSCKKRIEVELRRTQGHRRRGRCQLQWRTRAKRQNGWKKTVVTRRTRFRAVAAAREWV